MIIGLLACVGVYAACGIGRTIRNEDFKRYTSKYDERGRLHYMDYHGNEYINGEKIIDKFDRETNSMSRVGERSGIVYDSQELRDMRRNRKSREEAIANGKLAYAYWNSKLKRNLTVEISTGRVISHLIEYKNVCFKRYEDESEPTYIEISKEECWKLHVYGGSDVYTYAKRYYKKS